jgi:predicted nucleotidyltransferase
LNSSVLKWPDGAAVDQAARAWTAQQRRFHPEIVRIGYFGSYARGDWGVGSDLDLVVIVRSAVRNFSDRPLDWDISTLPVPAEILVYTGDEWERLSAGGNSFVATVAREAVWL